MHLDRMPMSHAQLWKKLEEVEANIESLEFLESTLSPLCSSRKILDLIGTHDMHRMHRIFKDAKRWNWSVEQLLQMMQDAKEGLYHPKNHDNFEYDLAMVIYELGGGAALHALHHSPFAFPALSTIASRRRDFKLRFTLGSPTMSDILFNIETMFKDVGPGHRKTGVTLPMDEIASDGRLCYSPETDEIIGLREHSAAELDSHKIGKNLAVMNLSVVLYRKERFTLVKRSS